MTPNSTLLAFAPVAYDEFFMVGFFPTIIRRLRAGQSLLQIFHYKADRL
jgi:hypothetical protein